MALPSMPCRCDHVAMHCHACVLKSPRSAMHACSRRHALPCMRAHVAMICHASVLMLPCIAMQPCSCCHALPCVCVYVRRFANPLF